VALPSEKVLLCGLGVLMVLNLKTIFRYFQVRFNPHSFIDFFPPVTPMPLSNTLSDNDIDIDPLLLLECEMCIRASRDLNSDDTNFSEHGGTGGSITSQYGEDDVDQDDDLAGHTDTGSTACTNTDRAAYTNANPSSFRPVADFCQQLKRRKLLRP
jgi:hypothetical protein